MILNILWLVCSLPIVTAGAATTALCRTVMDLDEPDQKPLFRRFFGTFRTGFGKSTVLFAIWMGFMAATIANIWFYAIMFRSAEGWMGIVSLLPAAVLLMISSYFFPIHAYFENSLGGIVKSAFQLTVVHLPATVLVTAINLIPVLVLLYATNVFVYLLPVWTLFGFSFLAYFGTYFQKKIFRMHLPEEKSEDENGENI